jgi:hypothetical protein
MASKAQIRNGRLSKGTQKNLRLIERAIVQSRHPMVEYLGSGVVRENFRNYDLTTKEGRGACEEKCKMTIAYFIFLKTQPAKEKNQNRLPAELILKTREFSPWLDIYLLIDDLRFQMETADLVDSF